MIDLLNKDCLDVMRIMRNDSIDCVITSPPYNMNLRIRYGKYCSRQINKNEFTTKYNGFDDNLPIDDFYDFHFKALSEMLRVSPLVFYNISIVTGSKRAFFKLIGDFNEQLKDIIVWDKVSAQPAMGEGILNRRTELLLVFDNSNAISRQFKNSNFKRGTMNDIWQITRDKKKDSNHKASFPKQLVENILLNFTKEGDLVLDPFMGTGTVGFGCKELNRNFIGCEIVSEYFNYAKDRL